MFYVKQNPGERYRAWKVRRGHEQPGRHGLKLTLPGRVTVQRVLAGQVIALSVASILATIVGFWLSYRGLHQFATLGGLHGVEAWAWPASVDLFTLAGELGVTIAALTGKRDPIAWAYLVIGFCPSVAFNVLRIDPSTVVWGRYAVAAVPPVAAMLALAALLRQVYRLVLALEPGDDTQETGLPKILQPVPSTVLEAATESMRRTWLAGNPWTAAELQRRFEITRAQAGAIRGLVVPVDVSQNGHANVS